MSKSALIKKFIIYLSASHEYTNLNISLEEAKERKPNSVVILEKGMVLYSQDTEFTISQIEQAKVKGFPYQWGFGPCVENIPFEKISYAEVKNYLI